MSIAPSLLTVSEYLKYEKKLGEEDILQFLETIKLFPDCSKFIYLMADAIEQERLRG